MPEADLTDLGGQEQPLAEGYGEKLTVVFFWTRGDTEFSAMAASQALEDLQLDVFEPYSEKGVQVVAVNEGDTVEDVKATVEEAGAKFTLLVDPEGALMAKVATEKLPRPYLLDAEGKILWFDLEFSRTTRDSLLQAIEVALGETGETEEAEEPGEATDES
jgi:peroxiredoxin